MKHETLHTNYLFDNNSSGDEVKQTLKHSWTRHTKEHDFAACFNPFFMIDKEKKT